MVLLAQLDADPVPEAGRMATHVDGDIEHRTTDHAHQLALGLLNLIVQAPQHPPAAAAVVVLHEFDVAQARGFGERTCVVALGEEAPRIAKHPGFKDQYFRQGG